MACTGQHPRIAVIAIISDAHGRVLAGQRLSALGKNQWSFPGGHLDQNEELFACAARETLEETGLRIRVERIVAVTNDVFGVEGKHYVSVFVRGERVDGGAEPETLEPNKCKGWFWKSWDEIREMVGRDGGSEVFLPVRNLVLGNPEIDVMVKS